MIEHANGSESESENGTMNGSANKNGSTSQTPESSCHIEVAVLAPGTAAKV